MIGKQAVEHDVVKLEIKLYRSRALETNILGSWSWQDSEILGEKNGGSDSSGVLKFSYRFGEVVIVNQPSGHGSTSPLVAQLVVLFIRVVIAAALSIDIPFSWVGV
ncbi:hypothetical protein CK203_108886 [Vitis vinifera]|uniref:Uncharacterized protein n=1 Tax=Vitis vinifera TaxID=29760 RepID=A0A438CSU0_VITVI|nr:hypothetical protein CK203_108886 [Vitis vinifera]